MPRVSIEQLAQRIEQADFDGNLVLPEAIRARTASELAAMIVVLILAFKRRWPEKNLGQMLSSFIVR
jgi:hypothetical protein